MNKKILILGSGMVAPPLVRYLLDKTGFEIVLADQVFAKAAELTGSHPRATPIELDIRDTDLVTRLISQADAVISILPFQYHPDVAKLCLQHRKSMITASYVSDSIRNMHQEAQKKRILILNEIGLDPGIDHMEAIRIIKDVESKGGAIREFTSFCGGLPAPEANTNPLGYKFSWSPMGVLMAGTNPALYLKDGKRIEVPPEDLFENPQKINIPGIGELDGYPNRSSIPYIDLYGIPSTRTLLRGTLRYAGWCPFIHAAGKVGLLRQDEQDLSSLSYADLLQKLIQAEKGIPIEAALAKFLDVPPGSTVIKSFQWLGLFSEEPIPVELKIASCLDVLAYIMQQRLVYGRRERDMIVLQHKFVAEFPEATNESITSTLIDYGIPGGDSAMARTVGLPLAISARLVIEGRISQTGIQIPVFPEIYEPILAELKQLGITFREHREMID